MDYEIMFFSSPGCNYNELDLRNMDNLKNFDCIRISKLENAGSLDVTQLFEEIYNGFDSIFVIIRGILKEGKFISGYNFFQKAIDEANRILEKRGFTNQRIRLLRLNGNDYKKLNEDLNNAFLKIVRAGKNPIKRNVKGNN